MTVRILIGDMALRLKELPDNSVDSCVCDPPYHLTSIVKRFGAENAAPAQSKQTGVYARSSKGFMGQTWDGGDVAFRPETWAEVMRVLKPGGHLLAFSGTRTYHRMAVAIEDAGFEVRDMIAWHYGSGFPKSLDVSKALDKIKDWSLVERLSGEIKRARSEAGLSLKEIGEATQVATGAQYGAWYHRGGHMFFETGRNLPSRPEWEQLRKVLPISDKFAVVYDEAEREVIGVQLGAMSGWSMGGKTKFVDRPITTAATEAAREWQGYGTALKPATEPICLARKPLSEKSVAANVLKWGTGALNIDGCRIHADDAQGGEYEVKRLKPGATLNRTGGNWRPENDAAVRFKGEMKPGRWPANLIHDGSDEVVAGFPESDGQQGDLKGHASARPTETCFGDMGPAADHPARNDSGSAARFFYCAKTSSDERGEGNNHPTVKPVELMRWLVRLVTPKGGTVLDPFMGSGSTLIAADAEQFNAIGCELSPEYAAIAERRIRDAAGMFADVKVAA